MPEDNFVIEGARLTIKADLQAGDEEHLRNACTRLLNLDATELTIDLREVTYVHSLSVGMLSYAWVEALSRDKEMTFIVSQPVADVFERTGLSKVFDYQVTEASG